MPPQSRSVLRSRRDLPQRVQALLESFGPADLALAAPEEPELPWTGLEGREETAARPAAPADAPAPIVEPAQAAPQPTPFVRPARETAKARPVDHLFATAAPQPQRTEAPAEPPRPRDPAVVDGETQVRELPRRLEDFRDRTTRPPQTPSPEQTGRASGREKGVQ